MKPPIKKVLFYVVTKGVGFYCLREGYYSLNLLLNCSKMFYGRVYEPELFCKLFVYEKYAKQGWIRRFLFFTLLHQALPGNFSTTINIISLIDTYDYTDLDGLMWGAWE